MHGVMANDEQSGLQHSAAHQGSGQGQPGELAQIETEQADQGGQPAQHQPSSEQKPSAAGVTQRPNLSSSAGDASRSIATK